MNKNNFLIPGAIIIAGVLITGAIFFSYGKNSAAPNVVDSVDNLAVDIEGEPFIGELDAPVTMAYWGDFQCPFCQRFDLQILPALVEQYVKKGNLKVVFKDFQFLGPDSQTAGLAAKAVWELYPNQYFIWHQAIFQAQDGENSGFGSKDDIIKLIREQIPGIDADRISAIMDQRADEYQLEQDADKAEGAQLGISGTPGFVIGAQVISGAQPASVLAQIIDAEL